MSGCDAVHFKYKQVQAQHSYSCNSATSSSSDMSETGFSGISNFSDLSDAEWTQKSPISHPGEDITINDIGDAPPDLGTVYERQTARMTRRSAKGGIYKIQNVKSETFLDVSKTNDGKNILTGTYCFVL
jgi:hypothetical protein